MRYPPSGRSFFLALVLLTGTLLAPFLAVPGAAYGEHVLAGNMVVSPGDPFYAVYSKQEVAQSFVLGQTASLLNVTLRVRNDGNNNNALTVAIAPNDPSLNVPSTPVLASTNVILTTGTVTNVSVSFSPAPALTAGEPYWILATNGASQQGNGYEWHYTNADVYPGGTAAVYNLTLGGWATVPFVDMQFVAYGRQIPSNVTLAMTVDRPRAAPDDLVNFTLSYNNTGTQTAPRVWVNDTLPAGLSYVADTATGATTGYPSYTFPNVTNGAHSFRITARVDVGVAPGTSLTNVATLAFQNATGAVQGGFSARATVIVGIATKQLYLIPNAVTPRLLTTVRPASPTATILPALARSAFLDFVQTPAFALDFHAQNATSTLWVTSNSGKAQTLVLDLTLYDRNGATTTQVAATQVTLVTNLAPSLQPATATFSGLNAMFLASHQVQLRVTNDAASTDALLLAVNGTGAPSRLDLLTPTYVNVDNVTLLDQNGPATVWSPLDSLVVQARVSDPFGAAKILGAWVNVTSPGGVTSASFLTTPYASDTSPLPAWKAFQTTISPALANGTYAVLVTGVEDNGVRGFASATALVRAPAFTFTQVPTVLRTIAGDRYAYDIWFNNTGTGPAGHVWINDTLPSEVTYQSWTSTAVGSLTGPYNWTWASVAPGPWLLVVNVQVGGSVNQTAYMRNVATLVFTDEKGHAWPAMASQSDVVVDGPVLTPSLSSLPASRVHANESVTYTIRLTNTGDVAQTIWANDTFPAGFVYVSDSHNPAWGTASLSAGAAVFRFTDMPASTTWTFGLTLRAPALLVRGSAITDVLTLSYSSTNGLLMPPGGTSLTLVASSPLITNATIRFLASGAGPGEAVPASVRFDNAGNEPAQNVWVNLTEDLDLFFLNASRPALLRYTTIAFNIASVPIGPYAIFLNLTVAGTTPDRHVVSLAGTVEYADGSGGGQPTVTATPASLSVTSAELSLTVSPGNQVVEAGATLGLGIYVFNAGSGPAADVWLNVTLPFSLQLLNVSSGFTPTILGSNLSWHWTNQAPGPESFAVNLAANPNAVDRSQASLPFRLTYADSNHYLRPAVNATAGVSFVAPVILVDLRADQTEVFPGRSFTYTITIRNNGSTVARLVSVSDAVDPRLELVTWSSSTQPTATQPTVWNFTSLAPGQSVVLNLTVTMGSNLAAHTNIYNLASVAYSNSLSTALLGSVRSPTVGVQVAADLLPIVLIAVGGLVATPLLAYVVSKREHVTIEEVFLVYRDGVLISHLSRTLMQDKDEDVLSGMLTAVQEFVRDAFRYGEHRELHQMDFGDYRILIERGKLAYLAVVYAGRDNAAIRRRVRTVLDKIETAYASVLESWDGDMERVVGVRDMMRDYLLKNGKGPKPALAAPAE